VISERKLVSSHSSFWRNAMPMAETFVRQMNRTLDRVVPPCEGGHRGIRNSLISELSFRIYCEICNDQMLISNLAKNVDWIANAADEVCRYISRLERSEIPLAAMTVGEIAEAVALAKNLRNGINYSNPGKVVSTRPSFVGCGIVDNCEGDILVGETLYELKNVERDFRLTDIRQLLTYCALNLASGQRHIDMIGLINARSGLAYKMKINTLSLSVAGVSANELLGEVIRYITVDTPSR
jgi:hypothetical protein